MAFEKSKEPKEPKEKKVKAPKEKKPKKPKKEKPPKAKKGKKGQEAPEEVEGQEGEEQPKKKKPLILVLIPIVVIAAAAAIIFLVVIPKLRGGDEDPDAVPSASPEPQPPELVDSIPIGDDVSIAGLRLGSDESEAQVAKSKRVTYTYSELVDAGKAAETYVDQLSKESPSFSVVDEEFARQTDKPDFTADEGMVLLARNVPAPKVEATPAPETPAPTPEASLDPDASAEPVPSPTPEPEPEPTPEPVTYVHTVRITWSPGVCVVTADEEEGKVTSPANAKPAQQSIGQRGAVQYLESMNPAELGLPGESMDDYEVLAMDGTQLVNDIPAIRMHVYSSNNAAGSPNFMGSYLMTVDTKHLYRLDPVTNEIVELDFTYNP